MNLAEFHKKYADVRSHGKIKIACDGCENEFEPLKTRAQQTIIKRGRYLCPSCGQIAKHAANPVAQKTKDKIAKGVHESRFKKLIIDLAAQIGLKTVLDYDLWMDANWNGGVLWTLEKMKNGEKVIIANYFDWYSKSKVWLFKEIYEDMGPIAICCPLRFLENATATEPVSMGEWWRDRVREYHKSGGSSKPIMPDIIEEWLKGVLDAQSV
jgi:hypothetical protein